MVSLVPRLRTYHILSWGEPWPPFFVDSHVCVICICRGGNSRRFNGTSLLHVHEELILLLGRGGDGWLGCRSWLDKCCRRGHRVDCSYYSLLSSVLTEASFGLIWNRKKVAAGIVNRCSELFFTVFNSASCSFWWGSKFKKSKGPLNNLGLSIGPALA